MNGMMACSDGAMMAGMLLFVGLAAVVLVLVAAAAVKYLLSKRDRKG